MSLSGQGCALRGGQCTRDRAGVLKRAAWRTDALRRTVCAWRRRQAVRSLGVHDCRAASGARAAVALCSGPACPRIALRGARTLIDAEITARDASNARARMKTAAFPVIKTPGELDRSACSIPGPAPGYLACLEWITARENLCLVGPAGTARATSWSPSESPPFTPGTRSGTSPPLTLWVPTTYATRRYS